MTAGFEAWIGREEEGSQRILATTASAMAATLDLEREPKAGDPLLARLAVAVLQPPSLGRSALGADGHPRRGGFLPPIELSRRMWAGSRIRYLAAVPIDAEASRRSKILKIENKVGKRGALSFVTVEHTISCGAIVCIREEQDLVYRDDAPPGSAPAAATPYDGVAQWSRSVAPDTTLLFRYSALTFNGHRIHYDLAYARKEEGYPDLVVHGPLTATLLQQFALEHGAGRSLARFEFRGITPLFAARPFSLEGRPGQDL